MTTDDLRHKRKGKLWLIVPVIIFVAISLFFVFQKSDEEKIFELTNNFAEALNEGDYDKMIECHTPTVQKQLHASANLTQGLFSGIAGKLFGLGNIELKDIFTLGAGMVSAESNCIKISIYSLNINKKTATADFSLDYTMDFVPHQDRGIMEFVKIGNRWYISNAYEK